MLRDEFLELRRCIIAKDFSKMNDKQQEAIYTVRGPLLLLAGAGSGKTTVLVNRIANMIKFGNAYHSDKCDFEPSEQDVAIMRAYLEDPDVDLFDVYDLLTVDAPQPWEILAITFTKKAAGELAFLPEIATELANIDGGLILRRGKIEINCSVGALFGELRPEYEGRVVARLFAEKKG